METVAGIRLPDSALARGALELARSVSPDFLLRHSQRTYVFGALVARSRSIAFEEELAYVAALLHDLGLTHAHGGDRRFELDGADAARSWARSNGMSEDEAQVVWDAIALHTSMGIAEVRSPECAIVHWGAGTDVAGVWLGELDEGVPASVIAAYPRAGFHGDFGQLIEDAAERAPAAYAQTWLSGTAQRFTPEHLTTSEDMLAFDPFALR